VNALDILHYGHVEVQRAFDGLDVADWEQPGVTTRWSPRDVLAHLASFELLLEDVLCSALGRKPTHTLDAFREDSRTFNDAQVLARKGRTPPVLLDEYNSAHERVMALANELGAERLRAVGTIPWYGPDYALDDFIVYANYAHKREHCGEVRQFRLRVKAR